MQHNTLATFPKPLNNARSRLTGAPEAPPRTSSLTNKTAEPTIRQNPGNQPPAVDLEKSNLGNPSFNTLSTPAYPSGQDANPHNQVDAGTPSAPPGNAAQSASGNAGASDPFAPKSLGFFSNPFLHPENPFLNGTDLTVPTGLPNPWTTEATVQPSNSASPISGASEAGTSGVAGSPVRPDPTPANQPPAASNPFLNDAQTSSTQASPQSDVGSRPFGPGTNPILESPASAPFRPTASFDDAPWPTPNTADQAGGPSPFFGQPDARPVGTNSSPVQTHGNSRPGAGERPPLPPSGSAAPLNNTNPFSEPSLQPGPAVDATVRAERQAQQQQEWSHRKLALKTQVEASFDDIEFFTGIAKRLQKLAEANTDPKLDFTKSYDLAVGIVEDLQIITKNLSNELTQMNSAGWLDPIQTDAERLAQRANSGNAGSGQGSQAGKDGDAFVDLSKRARTVNGLKARHKEESANEDAKAVRRLTDEFSALRTKIDLAYTNRFSPQDEQALALAKTSNAKYGESDFRAEQYNRAREAEIQRLKDKISRLDADIKTLGHQPKGNVAPMARSLKLEDLKQEKHHFAKLLEKVEALPTTKPSTPTAPPPAGKSVQAYVEKVEKRIRHVLTAELTDEEMPIGKKGNLGRKMLAEQIIAEETRNLNTALGVVQRAIGEKMMPGWIGELDTLQLEQPTTMADLNTLEQQLLDAEKDIRAFRLNFDPILAKNLPEYKSRPNSAPANNSNTNQQTGGAAPAKNQPPTNEGDNMLSSLQSPLPTLRGTPKANGVPKAYRDDKSKGLPTEMHAAFERAGNFFQSQAEINRQQEESSKKRTAELEDYLAEQNVGMTKAQATSKELEKELENELEKTGPNLMANVFGAKPVTPAAQPEKKSLFGRRNKA